MSGRWASRWCCSIREGEGLLGSGWNVVHVDGCEARVLLAMLAVGEVLFSDCTTTTIEMMYQHYKYHTILLIHTPQSITRTQYTHWLFHQLPSRANTATSQDDSISHMLPSFAAKDISQKNTHHTHGGTHHHRQFIQNSQQKRLPANPMQP